MDLGSFYFTFAIDIKLLQYHLSKGLSFRCWIAFASLLQIHYPNVWGSISGLPWAILICLFILALIPHFPHNCIFIKSYHREGSPSNLLFIFKFIVAITGPDFTRLFESMCWLLIKCPWSFALDWIESKLISR